MENVIDKYIIKTENCWIWSGGFRTDGYPRIHLGKNYYNIYRLTYLISKGYNFLDACKEYKNLKKMYSKCGDKRCVNPEHFRLEKLEIKIPKDICLICKKELEEKSNSFTSILKPLDSTQNVTPPSKYQAS